VLFVRYFLDAVAGLAFLLKGQSADARAVWSAHAHFLRSLPRFLKKRKVLRQNYVSQVYQGNLVFEHFVKKVSSFSQLKPEKWR
jgi:hypothetical protein